MRGIKSLKNALKTVTKTLVVYIYSIRDKKYFQKDSKNCLEISSCIYYICRGIKTFEKPKKVLQKLYRNPELYIYIV